MLLSKGRSCLLVLNCWIEVTLVLKGDVFCDVGEGLADQSVDDNLVALSSSDVRLLCRKFF